jgi:hypothetical protein
LEEEQNGQEIPPPFPVLAAHLGLVAVLGAGSDCSLHPCGSRPCASGSVGSAGIAAQIEGCGVRILVWRSEKQNGVAEDRWQTMTDLESKFQDYIVCARAHGDEVSPETPVMLDELCNRSHIKPDDLIGEIAKRDGLVKVRLDSGETILCFPDQLQPAE